MIEWIERNIPAWVYIAFIAHGAILGAVAYLILLERKTASWVQDRIGPNRVGFGGLLSLVLLPLALFFDIGKIGAKLRTKHMFGLGQLTMRAPGHRDVYNLTDCWTRKASQGCQPLGR